MQKLNHIIFLTLRFTLGFGVDLVVSEQIKYFLNKKYKVSLIVFLKDEYFISQFKDYIASGILSVFQIKHFEEIMPLIQDLKPDCIIAHTPPFYSLFPKLDKSILKVFFDHGEPPVHFFPDKEKRININNEKIEASKFADIIITMSNFISIDSGMSNCIVNKHGNDHLIKKYKTTLETFCGQFRKSLNLKDEFLVLNVSRYYWSDRLYKGVDEYIKVKNYLYAKYPDIQNEIKFVIVGHSGEKDVKWAMDNGLLAASNLSESELVSAYLDSNFYLSTSNWEGYNLGIAQALSFGLNTIASDKGAHKEFNIPVSNNIEILSNWIYQAYTDNKSNPVDFYKKIKNQILYSWENSNKNLEKLILGINKIN